MMFWGFTTGFWNGIGMMGGGDGGGDSVKETVVVNAAFASGVFESSD